MFHHPKPVWKKKNIKTRWNHQLIFHADSVTSVDFFLMVLISSNPIPVEVLDGLRVLEYQPSSGVILIPNSVNKSGSMIIIRQPEKTPFGSFWDSYPYNNVCI